MFTLNYKDPRLPTLCTLIGNVHNSDGSVYGKSEVFSQQIKIHYLEVSVNNDFSVQYREYEYGGRVFSERVVQYRVGTEKYSKFHLNVVGYYMDTHRYR